MSLPIQHIINLVDDLNREYYIKTQDDEWMPYEFHSCGSEWRVTFAETEAFSTIHDCSEEITTIESLEKLIKTRCSKIVSNFNYLKNESF